MRAILRLTWLVGPVFAAWVCPAGDPPEVLSVAEVAGIWKMCYAPDFEGEIDDGYLVLMPDSRFYSIGESCCREGHEPPIVGTVGTYSIEGRAIVFRGTDAHGKPSDYRLRYVESAEVVFFDNLKGPALTAPVLHAGKDLNYGFAKAFWPRARPSR